MAIDFTPVNDFFSNIKDKLTNPFFGTLIIVWLTRNWELVYSIFNFDNDLKLADKVLYIESYFSDKSFLPDLGICVLLALGFMIIGYLVILLTRSISIFVEYSVMPWLTKKIINKNTVLKTDYDKVVSERDDYFEKYESERKRVREFSADYEQQINLYEELRRTDSDNKLLLKDEERKLNIANNTITKLNELNTLQTQNIEKLKNELEYEKVQSQKLEQLYYLIEDSNNDFKSFVLNSKKIYEIANNIISKNLISTFLTAINFYKKGGSISSESINSLADLELIIKLNDKRETISTYGWLINKYILNSKSIENEGYLDIINKMKKNIEKK